MTRAPIQGVMAGRLIAVVTAVCGLGAIACSAEPTAPGGEAARESSLLRSEDAGRWVRRFLPFDALWRPESSLPLVPQKEPGMVIWEISDFPPHSAPTPAQRRAADDFLERCYQAALRNGWLDFQVALSDGYQLLFKDRRHYANWDFMRDGRVLDPDRPEFLMYYGTPQGKKLAGFMFYPNAPLDRGQQIGGPLTVWHWHVWNQTGCLLEGLLNVGVGDPDGRCARGSPTQRSPEMLHVWLIDHRDGPFATNMSIEPSEFRKLAAKRRKERGSVW